MRIVADVGVSESTLTITDCNTVDVAALLLREVVSGHEVLVTKEGPGLGVADLLDSIRETRQTILGAT